MMVPQFTSHGRQRWVERYRGFDFDAEWGSAKPPTKRQRVILGACGYSAGVPDGHKVEFMISASGIVFVLSADRALIVTVYSWAGKKRMVRERERWARERC